MPSCRNFAPFSIAPPCASPIERTPAATAVGRGTPPDATIRDAIEDDPRFYG